MGGVINGEYGVKYEDIKVYGMGLGYRVQVQDFNFGNYDIEIFKGLWFF